MKWSLQRSDHFIEFVLPGLKYNLLARELLRLDGIVVGASASKSVDLRFISLVDSYHITSKMAFTTSLLSTKDSEENKPKSTLVSLGKTFSEMPPSSYGRLSSLPVVLVQFN